MIPTLAYFCAVLAVVPALLPQQQTQLATATDFTDRFDEAALYPLLHNAVQWRAGDEAGAMVPDYGQLLASPQSGRGQLFLIEGQFNGQPRLISNLSRPGPWDGKLQQWVVLLSRDPKDVAVVYLVDPPRAVADAPRPGTPVRLVARFFKVLRDRNLDGQTTDFLIFVGKTATLSQGAAGSGPSAPTGRPILLAVVAAAGLWFIFRKMIRIQPTRAQERHKRLSKPASRRVVKESSVEASLPLPSDPAEALSVLEAEHGTTGNDVQSDPSNAPAEEEQPARPPR